MTRRAVLAAAIAAAMGSGLSACGGGGNDGPDAGPMDAPSAMPLFGADYAATYQQVRGCRYSLDHDLRRIRVLASPEAMAAYTGRMAPFPAGAIVLKEEYDDGDTSCTGPIVSFTVMQKVATGTSPKTLDWQWQEVSPDRGSVNEDNRSCVGCHTACGKAPEGHDGTCAVP